MCGADRCRFSVTTEDSVSHLVRKPTPMAKHPASNDEDQHNAHVSFAPSTEEPSTTFQRKPTGKVPRFQATEEDIEGDAPTHQTQESRVKCEAASLVARFHPVSGSPSPLKRPRPTSTASPRARSRSQILLQRMKMRMRARTKQPATFSM